jgi:hypothetical protein
MNSIRGDVTLELGGRQLTLRPTFHALAEMEGATGHALIALARRLSLGEATLKEIVVVIAAAAKAGGNAVALPELEAQVHAAGVMNVTEPVLQLLIGAITGQRDKG